MGRVLVLEHAPSKAVRLTELVNRTLLDHIAAVLRRISVRRLSLLHVGIVRRVAASRVSPVVFVPPALVLVTATGTTDTLAAAVHIPAKADTATDAVRAMQRLRGVPPVPAPATSGRRIPMNPATVVRIRPFVMHPQIEGVQRRQIVRLERHEMCRPRRDELVKPKRVLRRRKRLARFTGIHGPGRRILRHLKPPDARKHAVLAAVGIPAAAAVMSPTRRPLRLRLRLRRLRDATPVFIRPIMTPLPKRSPGPCLPRTVRGMPTHQLGKSRPMLLRSPSVGLPLWFQPLPRRPPRVPYAALVRRRIHDASRYLASDSVGPPFLVLPPPGFISRARPHGYSYKFSGSALKERGACKQREKRLREKIGRSVASCFRASHRRPHWENPDPERHPNGHTVGMSGKR